MSQQPTNCFICKNTWLGRGAVCDACRGIKPAPQPPPICTYCLAVGHEAVDCLSAAFQQQQQKARRINPIYASWPQMPPKHRQPRRGKHPYTNYTYTPPLKACPACKGNYLIESKAGSVCSNCREVVHHPCRNCASPNTRGLSCPDDNHVPGLVSVQMIECQDCLFME